MSIFTIHALCRLLNNYFQLFQLILRRLSRSPRRVGTRGNFQPYLLLLVELATFSTIPLLLKAMVKLTGCRTIGGSPAKLAKGI